MTGWPSRWGLTGRALAVIAHPDDESFGLGAVLAALVETGVEVSVLCLTRGEASTLGAADDLGARRDGELRSAAEALGVAGVASFDYPDGHLGDVDDAALDAIVDRHAAGASVLLVFEPGGVTGHPDHRAATASAERVAARRDIPVLEWGVSPSVATALREELGAPFVALDGDAVDIEVDRQRQLAAVACHRSQATGNTVLARRLALQGSTERVRYLPPPVRNSKAP